MGLAIHARAVPDRYRGVWVRRLLETPTLRDDTTVVHWLQTSHWHADLRVPRAARPVPRSDALAATLQGFAGTTVVEQRGDGEVCAWHRELDLQPPGPHPDEGRMQFEAADRVIETGIHGPYREVWERLPDSTQRFIALGRSPNASGCFTERLLVAGLHLMRVRSRRAARLELEISFGRLDGDQWSVQHSTSQALEGQRIAVSLKRTGETRVRVAGELGEGEWQLIEWTDAA